MHKHFLSVIVPSLLRFFLIQFKLVCSICLIFFGLTLFNTSLSCWLLYFNTWFHLCFLLYCIYNLLSELHGSCCPWLVLYIELYMWASTLAEASSAYSRSSVNVNKNNKKKPTLIFLAPWPEPHHIFCFVWP